MYKMAARGLPEDLEYNEFYRALQVTLITITIPFNGLSLFLFLADSVFGAVRESTGRVLAGLYTLLVLPPSK